MKPAKIYYTPEFLKLWRKVPRIIKNKSPKKEQLLRENIFNPILKTHKLKGKLSGFYSFSIDYHWRIVFHLKGREIYFDAVGTHSIYK